MKRSELRNVAIIAHVDHGKTTLVDTLLKAGKKKYSGERIMDSGDIEKKRGITILSKCTSITWKNHCINIVDTPGHRDFGSEVERILGTGMVDGVLLIVDALEGVMPQTDTVLKRAMENNLKVLVVVNKIDRPGATPEDTGDSVLIDLLAKYSDDPEILSTPIIYASGKEGIAGHTPEEAVKNGHVHCLLDEIIKYIPCPKEEDDSVVRASVAMLDHDPYAGKISIGRLYSGNLNIKDPLLVIDKDQNVIEKFKVTKLFRFIGLEFKEVDQVYAGDIYGFCGSEKAYVNHTIASNNKVNPVPTAQITPPMLSVSVGINTSPMANESGNLSKLNSRQVSQRFVKESYSNLGIMVIPGGNECELRGRGELQLGILFEQMRREGYEILVTAAKVINKEINGVLHEPMEKVILNIPKEVSTGFIRNNIIARKGQILDEDMNEHGNTVLVTEMRTAYLFGFVEEMTRHSKGMVQINKTFTRYEIKKNEQIKRTNGLMVATASGQVTAYALDKLRDRGIFFVKPGDKVCVGQVVGENNKTEHIDVNVVKGKKLTNMRASGKDDQVLNLQVRTIIMDDIFRLLNMKCNIEITPNAIRAHATWKR